MFYNHLAFGKIDHRNPTDPLLAEAIPTPAMVEHVEDYHSPIEMA